MLTGAEPQLNVTKPPPASLACRSVSLLQSVTSPPARAICGGRSRKASASMGSEMTRLRRSNRRGEGLALIFDPRFLSPHYSRQCQGAVTGTYAPETRTMGDIINYNMLLAPSPITKVDIKGSAKADRPRTKAGDLSTRVLFLQVSNFRANQAQGARSRVCTSCRQASSSVSASERRPSAGPGRSPKVIGSQSSQTGKAKSTM